jgi:hypothetical protein
VTEGDACVPLGGGVIDCGIGLNCVEGACVKRRIVAPYEDCADAQATGAMCPFGTECYWRPLPESVCIDASENTGYCDAALHCKDGYYCPQDWEELGRTCWQQGDIGEQCWMSEPYSCKAGLACNFGKCQPANAPAGTVCDSGEARFDWPFPAPCGAGLFCKPEDDPSTDLYWEGVCTPGYAVGAECEYSYFCASGICKNENLASHCVAPVVDGPCGYAGQCPLDTLCSADGKCRAPLALGAECTGVSQPCPTGSVCTSTAANGTKRCTAIAGPDEECSMAVCSDGQICIDPTNPG